MTKVFDDMNIHNIQKNSEESLQRLTSEKNIGHDFALVN